VLLKRHEGIEAIENDFIASLPLGAKYRMASEAIPHAHALDVMAIFESIQTIEFLPSVQLPCLDAEFALRRIRARSRRFLAFGSSAEHRFILELRVYLTGTLGKKVVPAPFVAPM
jgi:hypothetical protein